MMRVITRDTRKGGSSERYVTHLAKCTDVEAAYYFLISLLFSPVFSSVLIFTPFNTSSHLCPPLLTCFQGGFAHCYELIDMDTNEVYAGKIVPKTLLAKAHQKDKMTMEIDIHRGLSHAHIVGFHGFFEDKNHVYILLELCRRRSLMELHKRRKALTEPEVRYFLKQILLAVQHLHNEKVTHTCAHTQSVLHITLFSCSGSHERWGRGA